MSATSEQSDAELVARAIRGEDAAFTELMRRHKNGLFGFARRYVGGADAASDIVQETFVAAWRALRRYDSARSFGVWLRAIALNKCRDRARRLAVRRIVFGEKDLDAPEARRQADAAPNAESRLESAQRHAALATAIASLPAKLKEPLILTYFEGLSQQEAAEILEVSAKTVETRVYRARKKLAEALNLKLD